MGLIALPVLLICLKIIHALPFSVFIESDKNLTKHMDIIGINEAFGLELFEGDIKMDMKKERNTIIGNEYRWPLTVPYFLENGLDMNAKAVILKAFERFRLKTCIDFKPWEGEQHYISFFKDNGCYSYVGNLHKGKQYLSIGSGCDTYETVQHELLHALGFWHEQSRSDRDDYITIAWDMIDPGKRSNFNKYNDSLVNSLNTPYDYTSVMHYGKGAFQMGIEPTIITNNPLFNNIIGGQVDFSEIDQRKLNQLYNCTSSLSFMDSCSFELDDICAMVQSLDDDTDWQRVSQILGGPSSDHTYLGQDKASGYFMHFNTSRGNVWDRAMLESRLFYPKRGFQCLEFFYYNSGNESDQLNIWIREYTASAPNGTLKLIDSLQDISNLTVPQPTPVPTTSTQQTTLTTSQTTSSNSQLPALCANNFCKNDGICIMENQKPVCRCKAVGDWWYGGETCERRISSKANVLSFSCTLFVAITAITVGTLVTVI
ncbi:meprin A subunit beta-like isoform 3-T3 [Discoglossus pictus]